MTTALSLSQTHDPDELTPEEEDFVLTGDFPEIVWWNEQFASLVAEYKTAQAEGDPGWASSTAAEIRKRIEGVMLAGGTLAVEEQLLREVSEVLGSKAEVVR